MKRINAERLEETVFSTCLDNRLTIFAIKKTGFSKTAGLLGVNYGSNNLMFDIDGKRQVYPAGVAHFLEHKLFDMPDGGNALAMFSQMGASPNAFTSNSATAYHFECSDRFGEAFELLLKCVYSPHFTPESVEKERGIIEQEISMYYDMPAVRLRDELMSMLYREHPARHTILGTRESIGMITDKTLYECYDLFYQPSNMVLTVVGDIDPDMLEQLAARLTPPSTKTAPVFHCPEPAGVAQTEKTVFMDVPQTMFSMGVKLVPSKIGVMEHEMRCCLALAALCGSSSTLYSELYSTGLIDSSFHFHPFLYRDGGALYFAGRSRDPFAVRDALVKEAQRLLKNGIEPELFRRVKRVELGERLRVLDSPGIAARSVALDFLAGADYFTQLDVLDKTDQQAVCEIYSQFNNIALVQCRRNDNDV